MEYISVGAIVLTATINIVVGSKLKTWRKTIESELGLDDIPLDDIETVDLNMCHIFTIPISSSITLVVLLYFFSWVQYILLGVIMLSIVSTMQYLLTEISFIIYHNRLIHKSKIEYDINSYPKSVISTMSTIVSIIFLLEWIFNGNFVTHNFMASSLAIVFITLVRFPNLKLATCCLVLLLFYDIYWVYISEYHFKTNVMVEVAMKTASNPLQSIAKHYHIPILSSIKSTLDLPLKLIFPSISVNHQYRYSVLGLGDITLPGVVIAYVHDMDHQPITDWKESKVRDEDEEEEDELIVAETQIVEVIIHPKNQRNQLFRYSIIGYIIGLLSAIVASRLTSHPQPALLYLVPSVLIFLIARAIVEGRLLEIWNGPKKKDTAISL